MHSELSRKNVAHFRTAETAFAAKDAAFAANENGVRGEEGTLRGMFDFIFKKRIKRMFRRIFIFLGRNFPRSSS